MYFHSALVSFLTWKMTSAGFHASTAKCCAKEPATARMRYGFAHGGMEKSDLDSVTALSALNISIVTSTESATVPGDLSLKTSRPKLLANLMLGGASRFRRSCFSVILGPSAWWQNHQT